MNDFRSQIYCEAVARDSGFRHSRHSIVAALRAQGLVREQQSRNGRMAILCDFTAYIDLARENHKAGEQRRAAKAALAEGRRSDRDRELEATRAWARKADDERQAALDECVRLRAEVAALRERVHAVHQVAEFRRDIIDRLERAAREQIESNA